METRKPFVTRPSEVEKEPPPHIRRQMKQNKPLPKLVEVHEYHSEELFEDHTELRAATLMARQNGYHTVSENVGKGKYKLTLYTKVIKEVLLPS